MKSSRAACVLMYCLSKRLDLVFNVTRVRFLPVLLINYCILIVSLLMRD